MTDETVLNITILKEQMIKYGFHAPDMTVTEFVEDLPSVKPQEPKTGHWIRHDNGKYHWYLCSCCDAMAGSDERMMAYRYCPNCGTKMESEE